MSYRLKRGDASVQASARRIALGEIDAALALLGEAPERHIHALRTRMKGLRGLLRLIRPGLRDFATCDRAFRDVARALARHRDAEVARATLDSLAPDPAALPVLRAALSARAKDDGPATALPEATLATCRATLQSMRRRLRRAKLGGKGRAILARGLETAVAKAREALRAAEAAPSPEALHHLRKQVKAHLYHSRIFAPVNREKLKPRARDLDTLAELLGEHHDLSVLAALGETLGLPEAELADLQSRVIARQQALEAQIWPLAHHLLDCRPKALAARWIRWREGWRAR